MKDGSEGSRHCLLVTTVRFLYDIIAGFGCYRVAAEVGYSSASSQPSPVSEIIVDFGILSGEAPPSGMM